MKELYKLPARPEANRQNILQGDKYRITMLTEGLVRLEYSEDGIFEDRATQTVINLSLIHISIVSCCYMRAWTGYDVERNAGGSESEEYVYITETGTVYHRERNCTHLTLSIELAGKDEVEQLRNERCV